MSLIYQAPIRVKKEKEKKITAPNTPVSRGFGVLQTLQAGYLLFSTGSSGINNEFSPEGLLHSVSSIAQALPPQKMR